MMHLRWVVLIAAMLVIVSVFAALVYYFFTAKSTVKIKNELIWLMLALLIMLGLFVPVFHQGFL